MPDDVDEANEAQEQAADCLVSDARYALAKGRICSNPVCHTDSYRMANGVNTLFCRKCWSTLDTLPPLLVEDFKKRDLEGTTVVILDPTI